MPEKSITTVVKVFMIFEWGTTKQETES